MASTANSVATRQFMTATQAFQTKQIVDALVEEKLGNSQQIDDLLLSNQQLNNILDELKGEHVNIEGTLQGIQNDHGNIAGTLQGIQNDHEGLKVELETLKGNHEGLKVEFESHDHNELDALKIVGGKLEIGDIVLEHKDNLLHIVHPGHSTKPNVSANFTGNLNGNVVGNLYGNVAVGNANVSYLQNLEMTQPGHNIFLVQPDTDFGSMDNVIIGSNKKTEGHFTTLSADTLNVSNIVVDGNTSTSGDLSVGGNVSSTGNHSVGGDLTLHGDVILGDVSVTSSNGTLQFHNGDKNDQAILSATFSGPLYGPVFGPVSGSLLVGTPPPTDNNSFEMKESPSQFHVMPEMVGHLDNVVIGLRERLEGHFTTLSADTLNTETINVSNIVANGNTSTSGDLSVGGNLTTSGDHSVAGSLVLNGDIKVGDKITVTSNGETLYFKNSDDNEAVISATFTGCLNGCVTGLVHGGLIVGEPQEDFDSSTYPDGDFFLVNPSQVGSLDNVIVGERTRAEGHFTTVVCEDIEITGNSTLDNLTVTGDLHFGGEYNLTDELNKIIEAINTLYSSIQSDGTISRAPITIYGPYSYPYGPNPASVYPYGPYATYGEYPKLPKL
jgi:predicted acyltransferase (DUF342 family)